MAPTAMNIGDGERLQKSRQRLAWSVKGALFVVGMISGGYVGYYVASNDLDISAPWPPAIALAIAAAYLVALIVGSILLHRTIDEVERFRTYQAIAVAGTAYMVVYPLWFLLWKASVAAEPVHWILFLGFWALLIGSAFYYRVR